MVDAYKDLKRFLGEYCGCDVDAIHRRPREGGEPVVISKFEKHDDGKYYAEGLIAADTIRVTPYYYVFTDDVSRERCLEGGHMLLAASSKNSELATTLHSQRDLAFGHLCKLELRLDPTMFITECDEDKQIENNKDEDTIAFHAIIKYTLLDVLLTIYEFFGKAPFDKRYQRQVDEDQEIIDRLRLRDNKLDDDSSRDSDNESNNPETN